ncbi:DUF2946 family protein [Paenalcaligenes sp. Me52]|uniref:DUF2946 family protein n=1 Tax=Paenalcaligenes sp. Me52 TaxID=3392038 RepID=UPI003D27FBC2
MDELVLQGQQKWPNVPHAYGYLALSAQGHWHIYATPHAAPDFAASSRVTSPALQHFIERNYAADERGCWYFQNGPQRVYVMLEKAPLLLRLNAELQLCSHTHHPIEQTSAWYITDLGELYLQSPEGCGLIAGRDLPALAEQLRLSDDISLLDYLEHHDPQTLHGKALQYHCAMLAIPQSATVYYTQDQDLPGLSGFVRLPAPTPITDQSSL